MKKPTYDIFKAPRDIKAFMFRDLHHRVSIGTASDRYAGWMGQIYTKERYEGRITRRPKTVGGKSFVEDETRRGPGPLSLDMASAFEEAVGQGRS